MPTTPTYSHYSAEESLTPMSVGYPQEPGPKPMGLWLSVDGPDDWREWASAEMPHRLGIYRYAITLARDARVLHLSTPEDIWKFNAEYRTTSPWMDTVPATELPSRMTDFYIDWARLATTHQGIMIAPYQWSMRLDGPFWYYGWDCASGCLWDASAIATTELVEILGS